MGQNNSYPLFESIAQSESDQNGVLDVVVSASNSANSLQDDNVKNLKREKRERLLQHIGFVFYMLQTQPHYLSMLVKHALDKMNGEDGSYNDGDELEYIKLTYMIFNHMKSNRLKYMYLRSIIQLLYMIRLKGNKSLDNLLSILTVEDPVTQRNNYLDKVVETVLSHYHGVDLSIVNLDKMKRRSATVVYYGKVSQYHQEQQEFGNYGQGPIRGTTLPNSPPSQNSTTPPNISSSSSEPFTSQQELAITTHALLMQQQEQQSTDVNHPPQDSSLDPQSFPNDHQEPKDFNDEEEHDEISPPPSRLSDSSSSLQQITTAIAIQTRPSSHTVIMNNSSGRTRSGSTSVGTPPTYSGGTSTVMTPLSSSPTIHELGKQMLASSPSPRPYSYLGSSPYASSPMNDDRLELRVHTTMMSSPVGSHGFSRTNSMDNNHMVNHLNRLSSSSADDIHQPIHTNSFLYDSAAGSSASTSSSLSFMSNSATSLDGSSPTIVTTKNYKNGVGGGVGGLLFSSSATAATPTNQTPSPSPLTPTTSTTLNNTNSNSASSFDEGRDYPATPESSLMPSLGISTGLKKTFSESINKMKQKAKMQQDLKNFEEMCQASANSTGGLVIVNSPTNGKKTQPNLDLPMRSREYTLEKKIHIWEGILDRIHDKLVVHLNEAPFEHQYKLAYIHFFLTQIFDYASKGNGGGQNNSSKISSIELANAYIVSSYLRINKIRKKLQQVLINNNVRSKESHICQFLDIMSGHDSCLQTKEYKGVAEKASQIKKTILNWILQINITKQNKGLQQTFLEKHYGIPTDSDVSHKVDPPLRIKIGDFLNLAKIMFFNSSPEDEMKKVLTTIRQNLKYILSAPPPPQSNNNASVHSSSQSGSQQVSSSDASDHHHSTMIQRHHQHQQQILIMVMIMPLRPTIFHLVFIVLIEDISQIPSID
ncbi:hypothetical protein C9374_007620 [Naegleria lovaniensis]|uniref:Uncharacterized protein n=1 Tax=Naegleria lovaniensis TaxID=51637 RepID=A0AA88GGF2_NAELO|nr:uncharacterized protein C9374_007620 [Naegleria lovaniensis]KAG2378982.1 hypothetical protein C9374_007620 [Naegleria lovaniensis]